jgi:tetratricopeptide (TPR) repeat protein
MRTLLRFAALVGLVALLCAPSLAQPSADPDRLAPLLDGLGTHHRAADTESPLAQRYFDQGLVLAYAFNHGEAARAFREAQRLDPACAMCAWGEALVLGPHVNAPMMPDDVPVAWAALLRARERAANASPVDRALVEALAARYAEAPTADRSALDRAYADALRAVAAAHPADADVQSLFAEALMDTMPWDYWNADGSPKPATQEVLDALERSMAAQADHPGALHLWIHAVEKQRPELGVDAADRLAPLVPNAGHLVHMPSHIYLRVGRYHDAVEANRRATAADDAYLAQCHAQGLYPIGYVPHNHDMLWMAASMAGMREATLGTAHHLAHMADPALFHAAGGLGGQMQHVTAIPLLALVRFGGWDEILATPAPASGLAYPTGLWRFARGVALARTGRAGEAEAEWEALRPLAADMALDTLTIFGFNTPHSVLAIAERYLAGEVAAARGEPDAAVAALEAAVAGEGQQMYTEPPNWPLQARLALGAVLLDAGRAADAERVYRADLVAWPKNGWALTGLMEALRRQDRAAEADALRADFDAAWAHADTAISASRF